MPVASVIHFGAVQHAQEQGIERVVGLFNFVEENQGVGELGRAVALNVFAGEHGLRVGVADVAGRRAHQAGNFVLLLVFSTIDFEQGAGAAQQHISQRLHGMRLPAAGGPEQEGGAHGPARLPGLRFDALKQAENRIGGLGLAHHACSPTPRDVFQPGTARRGPQSNPFFGFVLDAYAGVHRSPFASDIPFRSPGLNTCGLCSPLSSAGSTTNMRIRGGEAELTARQRHLVELEGAG